MKTLGSWSTGPLGTAARSISCTGDQGSGINSFAVTSWRSPSSRAASGARSPESTRSTSPCQAAPSRSAVTLTTL
jgi:hypothetical protein